MLESAGWTRLERLIMRRGVRESALLQTVVLVNILTRAAARFSCLLGQLHLFAEFREAVG